MRDVSIQTKNYFEASSKAFNDMKQLPKQENQENMVLIDKISLMIAISEIGTSLGEVVQSMESWATFPSKNEKQARNKALSIMFLYKLDRKRYGDMLTECYNEHRRVIFNYPEDMASAYAMAIGYKKKFVPTEKNC